MRSAIVWHCSGNPAARILIEAEPLALMDKHWQDQVEKRESGGILLGYRRGVNLHVTTATPPQSDDRRWRFLFKRSARYHQEIALRQWTDSKRTIDYLGEWHTHPQEHPRPSMTDLSEWSKISAQRQTPMVFVIMGWNGESWVGLSKGREIDECVNSINESQGDINLNHLGDKSLENKI